MTISELFHVLIGYTPRGMRVISEARLPDIVTVAGQNFSGIYA